MVHLGLLAAACTRLCTRTAASLCVRDRVTNAKLALSIFMQVQERLRAEDEVSPLRARSRGRR